MKAMILAAGRGTRMRPLTDTLPKPLLQIGGKPLIVWHLENLASAGYLDVVINVSWKGDMIRKALGDGSTFGLRISYSDEATRALETAGGISKALSLLGDQPFLVVNGDVFSDYPLTPTHLAEGKLAHLVLVSNPPHNDAGDFALQDGQVQMHGERLTFSGIGFYSPELFAGVNCKVCPLAPLLVNAIAGGTVTGEVWAGEWRDVGTPERFRALAFSYNK